MPDADGKSSPRRGIDHQRRPPLAALAALAARQGGLASLEQLRGLGFSDAQIWRLSRDGWLHRVHHNLYAVGHRQLSHRAHLLAALMTLGPRAFLSHRTAAAATSSLTRRMCRTRGDLRVSSVPRMLIELAAREAAAELERLVTEAVHRRRLRPDSRDGRAALEAALARHPRHPGMAKLTAVLATYRRTESSKSRLERAFDRLLAAHPEIPDPQRNIDIDHWEIDRFWPGHNLAVELDGRPYHIAAGEMERDRIKDAALLRKGITPLRFTDFRVEHDLPGILRDLHHFLALG